MTIRVDDGKDIVEELRNLAAGDPAGTMKRYEWGPQLAAVLERAIAEIQFLRGMAGVVSQGESFAEIKEKAREKAHHG